MEKKIETAKNLIDDFCQRTGLVSETDGVRERYLWTDAFAVQTLFALSQLLKNPSYAETAQTLIRQVHQVLGTFHPEEARQGRLSSLSEEEAKKHPTVAGLRIGKKLPERPPQEAFDEKMEWERDGQYFHYLTRWAIALLSAYRESGEEPYALWAYELMKASEKFIYQSGNSYGMYWKMNTDLTRPLINSMGAHDPLEGLICTLSIQEAFSEKSRQLESLKEKFMTLCRGKTWATTDSLGIGGLLFNALRAFQLSNRKDLPDSVQPENLLQQSLSSLEQFLKYHHPHQSANSRLAFRECGLSLGIRTLVEANKKMDLPKITSALLQDYNRLADEIESFWADPGHQKATTWTEHLTINTVSLAASLTASKNAVGFLLD